MIFCCCCCLLLFCTNVRNSVDEKWYIRSEKVGSLCWVSFTPDLLLQLSDQAHPITKFLIHLLSLENFQQQQQKDDFFFSPSFYFFSPLRNAHSGAAGSDTDFSGCLLALCTAANTKPLTSASESSVNNSMHPFWQQQKNKGFAPLLLVPEGALVENKEKYLPELKTFRGKITQTVKGKSRRKTKVNSAILRTLFSLSYSGLFFIIFFTAWPPATNLRWFWNVC